MGIDLNAVVKSVPMTGEGIDQELGALLPDNPEATGDDPHKKILQMNRAVAEVE